MKKVQNEFEKLNFKNLKNELKYAYATSLKDPKFKALCSSLHLKEEILIKRTSQLERTVSELKNCEKCKGLGFCANPVCGFVYYPKVQNDNLEFSYMACKYKKKSNEEKCPVTLYELPYEMQSAKMSEIDITDKKRAETIKWLKKFYDNYHLGDKGLYLHGSFGSGKTYLVVATLNELAKKGYDIICVYFPFLLRNLKESFSDDFNERINSLMKADILLLDDIGAENVTLWGRDEILGTILQYRMENKKTTFLTSNLNIDELEVHLANTKSNVDKLKARRIIERIKVLTDDIELVSVNRRR